MSKKKDEAAPAAKETPAPAADGSSKTAVVATEGSRIRHWFIVGVIALVAIGIGGEYRDYRRKEEAAHQAAYAQAQAQAEAKKKEEDELIKIKDKLVPVPAGGSTSLLIPRGYDWRASWITGMCVSVNGTREKICYDGSNIPSTRYTDTGDRVALVEFSSTRAMTIPVSLVCINREMCIESRRRGT